jgi:hypothetical protein
MIYQGIYTGSYSGKGKVFLGHYKMSGKLSITVDDKGVITGSYKGKLKRPLRAHIDLSGTLSGTVTDSGVFEGGGVISDVSFKGQLTRELDKIKGKGSFDTEYDNVTIKGDWDISGKATVTS